MLLAGFGSVSQDAGHDTESEICDHHGDVSYTMSWLCYRSLLGVLGNHDNHKWECMYVCKRIEVVQLLIFKSTDLLYMNGVGSSVAFDWLPQTDRP